MAINVTEIPQVPVAPPKADQRDLAILDREGSIVRVGPSLPALALEDAERVFVDAKETMTALKRFLEFVEGVVVSGWTAKKQVEGILGGRRYKIERKPGTYVYQDEALFKALKPFVGSVITEEERIEALGWNYEPARIVPAATIPEIVTYAPSTQKLDGFAGRRDDLKAVIEAHRTRALGDPKLVEVKK